MLEEAQRGAAKERKATATEWVPKFFAQVRVDTPPPSPPPTAAARLTGGTRGHEVT